METTTFARKPFYVQAVQVTEENFDKIAEWTGGTVTQAKQGKYIKVAVQRFLYERQTQAFVGDWILYTKQGENDSFKVYTDGAFRKSFDAVKTNELAAKLKAHFTGEVSEDQTALEV